MSISLQNTLQGQKYNSIQSSGKAPPPPSPTQGWNMGAGICSHTTTGPLVRSGHWCWSTMPGSQLAFQFVPVVLDGTKVKASCRPLKFFPHQTGETISQCQVQIAKGAVNKLLQQSWRHTTGQERFLSAVALGILLKVVNAGFIIFIILCLYSESNAVNVSWSTVVFWVLCLNVKGWIPSFWPFFISQDKRKELI